MALPLFNMFLDQVFALNDYTVLGTYDTFNGTSLAFIFSTDSYDIITSENSPLMNEFLITFPTYF